ncbi:unnamed protein product, partial [Mesorhabditis belari]|uniref:Thioredoxin domain-containing protein n=1 Tax=Mesorhabditis belari TaxID=2138241 RepID=A0AAF3JA26_9BILA
MILSVFFLFLFLKNTNCELYRLYDGADPVTILNRENFDETVYGQKSATFVHFYVPWCSVCSSYAPIYNEFAREVGDWKSIVKVAVVNCDENGRLCKEHVRSYPSFRYFPYNATTKEDAKEYQGSYRNITTLPLDLAELNETSSLGAALALTYHQNPHLTVVTLKTTENRESFLEFPEGSVALLRRDSPRVLWFSGPLSTLDSIKVMVDNLAPETIFHPTSSSARRNDLPLDEDLIPGLCKYGTWIEVFEDGTYRCRRCKTCWPGQYELAPCQGPQNTICVSCSYIASKNRDFRNKCTNRNQKGIESNWRSRSSNWRFPMSSNKTRANDQSRTDPYSTTEKVQLFRATATQNTDQIGSSRSVLISIILLVLLGNLCLCVLWFGWYCRDRRNRKDKERLPDEQLEDQNHKCDTRKLINEL